MISTKFQIQKWEELGKGILPSSLCIQRIAFSENSSSPSENHIQSKRSVGTAWHRLCVWIEVVSYPLFHRNRVSLFPPQDCKGFTAFMKAGPSDYRRRSRSPVRPEGDVGARLNELIAEGQAGRWFQSRRKSWSPSFWPSSSIIFIFLSLQSQLREVREITWDVSGRCWISTTLLNLRTDFLLGVNQSFLAPKVILRARTLKAFILHHQRTRNWSREQGIQLIRGRYLLGAGHRSQIVRLRKILSLQLQHHQQHRNRLHLLQ